MSADDLLAEQLPGLDIAHLLVEHGALVAQLRDHRRQPTADQRIRAAALQAASSWLAGIDPYPQGRHTVLDAADVFAHWIQTGERQ